MMETVHEIDPIRAVIQILEKPPQAIRHKSLDPGLTDYGIIDAYYTDFKKFLKIRKKYQS